MRDEAVITIAPPNHLRFSLEEGPPIVGGSVQFRGRAVAEFSSGLPRRPWTEFNECPDEDFSKPAGSTSPAAAGRTMSLEALSQLIAGPRAELRRRMADLKKAMK